MVLPVRLISVSLALGLGWVALELPQTQSAEAANPKQVKQLLKTKKCPGCDLSYANLARKNLKEADLTGANLTAANLQGADLDRANLTGATLNHADLSDSDLNQANLTQASLVFARFDKAVLEQANLTNAILGGSDRFSRVKSLAGATLPNGRPAVEGPWKK